MFAQNREDRKKVKSALDAAGLPSGKVWNCSLLLKFCMNEGLEGTYC